MNSFFKSPDKLSELRAEKEIFQKIDRKSKKVYFLCIDFIEKDLAITHKCKFDGNLKLWYCEDKTNPLIISHTRVDLNIEYKDKNNFKALGAKYCPIYKVWYGKSGNTELMKAYYTYKDLQNKKREEEQNYYGRNRTDS